MSKGNQEKSKLHDRNKNRDRYDLDALVKSNPELSSFITLNKFGVQTITFSDPAAVKALNKAILQYYYGVKNWDFPDENLCPPVPGRADYIHYISDLLTESNAGKVPDSQKITCLDIGVGASCIYPILGVIEYSWNFIGSDIDPKSIATARGIVNSNPVLKHKIDCRLQSNSKAFFKGIIKRDEKIDVSLCNPPFHASAADALKGTRRKIKNLSGKNINKPELNFAGISNELFCDGGEYQFIKQMIIESKQFSDNCFWFSTLVSKQSNLRKLYKLLEQLNAVQIKTIPLGTGNKMSRILAWTFLAEEKQKEWMGIRWDLPIR